MGQNSSIDFRAIDAAISRIQSGKSQPRFVMRQKGGEGHVTVRVEEQAPVVDATPSLPDGGGGQENHR